MLKSIGRRRFLALAGGGAISFLVYFLSDLSIRPAGKIDLMRPPGAVEESAFEGACIRCQRCVYVCPTRAIKPATISEGLSKVSTPILDGECIYCWACIEACPSGALQQISLEDFKVGNAAVLNESCIRCMICVRDCPFDAFEPMPSPPPRPLPFPVVETEKCTGCGKCWVVCPTIPKSIAMTSEGAKRVKVM